MYIFTKITVSMITGKVLEQVGYEYTGPLDLACGGGPSSTQLQLQQEQMDFYKTLTSDYNQQFSNQQNIISALTKEYTPILQAGPDQFGLSKAEETTLRTQAEEGTAQRFAQSKKALETEQAAAGGGNVAIGSGAQQQQREQLSSATAAEQSAEDLGITRYGYDIGRQNWTQAANVLGSTAGLINPTGYAGQATGAGSSAEQTANQIAQEEAASSPWSTIGGVLGGGLASFAGGYGSALGKK